MKSIRYCALLAIVALCNLVSVSAQGQGGGGRGNFDPAQFRERMLTRVREEMDVKDDADWKLISDRVTKVMDAERNYRAGTGMGMMFRPRRTDQNADQNADQNGGRRRGPGGFGQPSPEAEALQKALENKASNDDVKTALAKFRDSRKAKKETLDKAQDDLRKVLTPRQEAAAVAMGLLE